MQEESHMPSSRKRAMDGSNDGYATNKRYIAGSGKPTLRFLVADFMAGKLIGKGGTNISVLKSKFDASIRISPNKQYYPGTSDRIVTVSGDIEQIIEFNNYLVSEIEEDGNSEGKTPSSNQKVKMVISDVAAGLVIGKGGASIKAIQTACNGAKIYISKKEESLAGERILVVSGDSAQLAVASKRVLEVMSAEPDKISPSPVKYNTFTHPLQMQMLQHNPPVYNYQGDNSHYMHANLNNGVNNISSVHNSNNYGNSNNHAKSKAKVKFQMEMDIPDKMVGYILGKQGQTIMEFSRNSGAKLEFSGKDEFVPGTTDRVLKITGGMYQVQNAYFLVDDKLAQIEREFRFLGQ